MVGVGGGTVRRRSRQARPRLKVVQFSLTQEEFYEVSRAAERCGLARGAFGAEATLAAARGAQTRATSPLREVLGELMAAAGLVARIGTNLNQAATCAPGRHACTGRCGTAAATIWPATTYIVATESPASFSGCE